MAVSHKTKSFSFKVKKDDLVQVIAGRSKGNTGKILKVFTKTGRVLVEGSNMIKKHMKPDPNRNIEGGIVVRESPLDVSNVAIYNSTTGKADKIAYKFLEDGRKVRMFKSTGELID